jgi:hypothetical protein
MRAPFLPRPVIRSQRLPSRGGCPWWRALALCAALAWAAPASAQSKADDPGAFWPGNVDMTRSSGMGGAHAAIATGNDALVVNPAGLSQLRRYHFQVDGAFDSRFPGQGVTISAVDSSSIVAGSGILFQRWGAGVPEGRGEGWLAGLGYAYYAGNFFFGGLTKYLRFDGYGDNGQIRQFAQDVGMLVRTGDFSWAAVMQNISTSAIPLFPLTSTLGVNWGTDTDWHLAFDYKTDLSDFDHWKHRVNGGIEILFDRAFVLRGGYSWDLSHSLGAWSLGTSIITERIGLHAAWRRRIQGPLDQFFEFGLTFYLE